jgi:hypothetical protein
MATIETCVFEEDRENNKIIMTVKRDGEDDRVYERSPIQNESLTVTQAKWINDKKDDGFEDLPGEEDRVGFEPPRPKVLRRFHR